MATKSRKKNVCWYILYPLMGAIDIIQIVIDFTGIGVIVSEALEIVAPILLIGILKLFGISIFEHPNRLISLIATDLVDAATGGAAPLWIIDVWYIHRDVKRAQAEEEGSENSESALLQKTNRAPLHDPETGARLAANSTAPDAGPVNRGPIRPPSGKIAR